MNKKPIIIDINYTRQYFVSYSSSFVNAVMMNVMKETL